MLVKTTLPNSVTSSDPYVITVFQLLDGTINGSDTIHQRLRSEVAAYCGCASAPGPLGQMRTGA